VTAGKVVPAGTVAVARSSDFLRASGRATALATLIRQRRLTPSCGGHAPTAERTVGPARMIVESLTPRPGIREHYRHKADLSTPSIDVRFGGKRTYAEAGFLWGPATAVGAPDFVRLRPDGGRARVVLATPASLSPCDESRLRPRRWRPPNE
jgi:hypothetical protein